MFKSLFSKNSDTILAKATDIAFDAGHFLEGEYEDLSNDSKLELFLFNYVHAWLYLQEKSLIKKSEETAGRYIAIGSVKAQTLKRSIDAVEFYELFRDRFIQHSNELDLVLQTQFTSDEYFPRYYYVRVYDFPLQTNDVSKRYYEHEFFSELELTDMYKHQVQHVQKRLQQAF